MAKSCQLSFSIPSSAAAHRQTATLIRNPYLCQTRSSETCNQLMASAVHESARQRNPLRWVRWYKHEHRHSAIRFVTPAERHAHLDQEILAPLATLYTAWTSRRTRASPLALA